MRTHNNGTGTWPGDGPRGRRRITAGGPVLRIGALTGALALAATACSPAGSGDGDGSSKRGSGKNLVIARTTDLDQLDPATATAFGSTQTLRLLYDTLLRTDDDGKFVPGLATRWETSKDGRKITFKLRKGVSFHNGDRVTADAVVATVDRILDESTASVVRSNLLSVSDVTAPDATTAVVELSKPDPSVLHTLTTIGTAVLDPADIEAKRVGKRVNGTGPFELASRTKNQKVELRANPNYFEGRPSVAGAEFRVIPDETSILAGLKAGSFDAGVLTDPNVVNQAKGGLKVHSTPSLAYHTLMLNGRRSPLDKLQVRQAIACAVDRKQVIGTAVAGRGAVTGPVTSPGYGLSATEGLPCKPGDTASAKKLLRQSGVRTPVKLKMLVMTGSYASATDEAQNLQSQLRKAGIEFSLEQETSSVYVKRWSAADYDAALALNGGDFSPYLMYARYFGKGGSLAKPAGLTSPKLAGLLADANAAAAADEGGAASGAQAGTGIGKEAVAATGRLQKSLLELSPWVWLFTDQNVVVTGDGVKGLGIGADGSLRSLTGATKR